MKTTTKEKTYYHVFLKCSGYLSSTVVSACSKQDAAKTALEECRDATAVTNVIKRAY